MHKGLGHQPEPPPRPVWEWWRYPACWAALAIIAGIGVAAATVSAWLWAVFVVLVGVVVFGDGVPNSPTAGAYTLGQAVPLYDPTNPDTAAAGADKVTVPADAVVMRGGPWDGKPVWCEWMPYQKTKAAQERAAGGTDAPPR